MSKFNALKLLAVAGSLSLASCANNNSDAQTANTVTSTSHSERIFSGDYSSPAWVSGEFEGQFTRTLTGNQLTFSLDEKNGGMDTAVARTDLSGIKVDAVHPDLAVCSNLTVDGDGFWWAGPKVSVNWRAMTDEGKGEGIWYENYIIDKASLTPDEMENWVYDIHKGDFIGTTEHDGSVYKHYLIHFKSWKQYWAIRQDYRDSGVTSIKPILNKWRELGLENRDFDGVKLNIEFHGPAKADVAIKGYIPRSYQQSPDLAKLNNCQ